MSRVEHPVFREDFVAQRDSKVSVELQKLSLEDFSDQRETARKHRASNDSKKIRNYEIVFGVSPCLLALTQGRRMMSKLFVKEGEAVQRPVVRQVCKEAERLGVPVHRDKKELDRMVPGQVHQGCVYWPALGYLHNDRVQKTLNENGNKTLIWLVLDGQDPMNLGAVCACHFLGVDRVASSLRNSCPLTPVVSKASSGVMEIMGVYGYENLADMVKVKKTEGWQVVGTVGAEAVSSPVPVIQCSDFQITKPTLLLMGSEGKGLSLELRHQCNFLLDHTRSKKPSPWVSSHLTSL
ncbi:LOW QUALITY PROTEIN: rRNA methyltransferase 1, mitochondrial [Aplochiton taeniatus]